MKYSELKRLVLTMQDTPHGPAWVDQYGEVYRYDISSCPKVGSLFPDAPKEDRDLYLMGYVKGGLKDKPNPDKYADRWDYITDLKKWRMRHKSFAVVEKII